jgi:hypothetical protein
MRGSRWRGGVYVIRTRKHHAIFGLPLVGRHFGYVGETNSFRHRVPQHLVGGGRYRVKPKCWADLDPVAYTIPLPDWYWLRSAVETLLIAVLCPVYNGQKQRAYNLRRALPSTARDQRYARDVWGRWAGSATLALRCSAYSILVSATLWGVFK